LGIRASCDGQKNEEGIFYGVTESQSGRWKTDKRSVVEIGGLGEEVGSRELKVGRKIKKRLG